MMSWNCACGVCSGCLGWAPPANSPPVVDWTAIQLEANRLNAYQLYLPRYKLHADGSWERRPSQIAYLMELVRP